MVVKWKKFLEKSPYKKELQKIISDISEDSLENYYIKPLKGYDNYFRIRKWKIRVVFEKTPKWNAIVAVDTRWNIYRWL